ncbi:DMT family transporter [Roseovarius sp. E0-M6]|uniref:DMT family transporter n=1 Tax=Roseovarius sp. E0-M6 TaxID=3127118 RepID=UPI0030102325
MTPQKTPGIDLVSAAMLLLLALVWGGSFFFAEVTLTEVPPLTITLHRVSWALPVLYMVLRLRGFVLPRGARIWAAYLVMGALNNAIPFSLIFWGQTQITSGLAAILNGTTAVFGAVVAGLLLADEPLLPRKVAGACLGLAGVAVIIGPGALTDLSLRNIAQLAVLGAALSYALASVWAKTALGAQPPVVNAFGMLAGSTVLMIPVVLVVDGVPSVSLGLGVWAALGGVALLSTALAYMLYFSILARAGAANLMLVTLLIPPFAIILGALFLDERIDGAALAGFGIIALGLIVTDGRIQVGVRRCILRTVMKQ